MLGRFGKYSIDCALERRSASAYIGPERDRLDDLNRETEAALSFGLPADFVDRAPLPFATGGAVRFTDQAQCNPLRYLQGLADAVTAEGGEIYENSRVIDLQRGHSWRLTTEAGELEADQVFLATNLPVAGPADYGQRNQPRYPVALADRTSGGWGKSVSIRVDHG